MSEDSRNWKLFKDENEEFIKKSLGKGESRLTLGQYYTNEICLDAKHLSFTLSRYKFVSKMLAYRKNVKLLEMGCNEGLGALLFQQNLDLSEYVGIDLDSDAINWNKENLPDGLRFVEGDFFECGNISGETFDAVVSLDVIEHINQKKEHEFCRVMIEHMKEDGVAVIGTPNIVMQPFAREVVQKVHINLYDQERLYELMNQYFRNVFIFNMTDEVVHTGFNPMSCYIFAVCCNFK